MPYIRRITAATTKYSTPYMKMTDAASGREYHARIYLLRTNGAVKHVEFSPNSPNLPGHTCFVRNDRTSFFDFHEAASVLLRLSHTDPTLKQIAFRRNNAVYPNRHLYINVIERFLPLLLQPRQGRLSSQERLQKTLELQQQGMGRARTGRDGVRHKRKGQLLTLHSQVSAALAGLQEIVEHPDGRGRGYDNAETLELRTHLTHARAAMQLFHDAVLYDKFAATPAPNAYLPSNERRIEHFHKGRLIGYSTPVAPLPPATPATDDDLGAFLDTVRIDPTLVLPAPTPPLDELSPKMQEFLATTTLETLFTPDAPT